MSLLAKVNIPQTFDKIDLLTGKGCVGASCAQFDTVGELISVILPNVMIISGVIFFVLILGGGLAVISSAGKDSSPQEKAKARSAITFGIAGFLLVVTSFFILQIVEKIVGIKFINPFI